MASAVGAAAGGPGQPPGWQPVPAPAPCPRPPARRARGLPATAAADVHGAGRPAVQHGASRQGGRLREADRAPCGRSARGEHRSRHSRRRPRAGGSTRRPEPGPGNSVLYVFVVDPDGAGRGLRPRPHALAGLHGRRGAAQETWKLYTSSVTGGGSLLNLSPVPEAPPSRPEPAAGDKPRRRWSPRRNAKPVRSPRRRDAGSRAVGGVLTPDPAHLTSESQVRSGVEPVHDVG